ncbi:MAG: bifunctional nuclease family protein [Patescibacteria group bacterium]|nr:bifunctional nuclease family protein [Patescibacteria group bacterium]MDE2015687.1 bifunctional nuclease family protein [Patescibacteria group bacterium]MDE2226744.1 bifunctional nuclease family protein [Patescibacteria group bacterium]
MKLSEKNSKIPPSIVFFLRDKETRSCFPVVFDETLAKILIDAVQGENQQPLNEFGLNQKLLSYGSIKVIKTVITEFKNDYFATNLHLMVNGEEKIESVFPVIALETVLRNDVPIVIPEDVFIEAIENPTGQWATQLFFEHLNELGS